MSFLAMAVSDAGWLSSGAGAILLTFLTTKFWPEIVEYFKRSEKREVAAEQAAASAPEKALARAKTAQEQALELAASISKSEEAKRIAWQGEIRQSYIPVIAEIKRDKASDIEQLRTTFEAAIAELRQDRDYWRQQTHELKDELLAALVDSTETLDALKETVAELGETFADKLATSDALMALTYKTLKGSSNGSDSSSSSSSGIFGGS